MTEIIDPQVRQMADRFPASSVPAPRGRERRSLIYDWIEAVRSPPAPRWERLPLLRPADALAPRPHEIADSRDRLAKRYGERVMLEHLLIRKTHNLSGRLRREPAACLAAAVDARIVGASPIEIAHDFAASVELRWETGDSYRSKTAERLIQRGDEQLWHLGAWPWAAMSSTDEMGLAWEWWSDPRCLESFRAWWAEGWVKTLDAEAELRWQRARVFGCSIEDLGWANPDREAA